MASAAFPPMDGHGVHPYAGLCLYTLLEQRAATLGDKPFVTFCPFYGEERVLSYRQMHQGAASLAGWLQQNGVSRGDRLLIHADNTPEILTAIFAAAAIGAIPVTTNTRSSRDELQYFVHAARPSLIIASPAHLPLIGRLDLAAGVRVLTTAATPDAAPEATGAPSLEDVRREGLSPPRAAADPRAPGLIQFTSGTTARPKGVLFTQANLLWGAQLSAIHQGLGADDIHFVSLPLFHVNALCYSSLATLYAGGSLILTPKFSASRFWNLSVRHRCTWASQTGFTHRVLLGRPVPERHFYRYWGNGVADTPDDAAFGVRTIGWWGMTETVSHPIITPLGLPVRPMSMGRPSFAYGVSVIDADGAPARPGENGALRISGTRGLSLFAGYWEDPDATRAAFDDEGRLITGDVATLHEDGCLSFVEREKDMLKVAGENVAASEIERVIAAAPGVEAVAVVGMPDPMRDEAPCAFVVSGVDPRDHDDLRRRIEQACAEGLADFKRPREIRFIDELPRATLGKIRKRDLKAALQSTETRSTS